MAYTRRVCVFRSSSQEACSPRRQRSTRPVSGSNCCSAIPTVVALARIGVAPGPPELTELHIPDKVFPFSNTCAITAAAISLSQDPLRLLPVPPAIFIPANPIGSALTYSCINERLAAEVHDILGESHC